MSSIDLRREIKKAIDRVPSNRLESLADYVRFLSQSPLAKRLETAEKDVAAGKGVSWRKVRADV